MNRTAKKIVSVCVLLSVNLPSFAQKTGNIDQQVLPPDLTEYVTAIEYRNNTPLIVCLLIVNIILSIILLISKYKGKKE